MDTLRFTPTARATRAAVALAAVLTLFAGGAAWHGLAAGPDQAAPQTATTPITHAIAGGRDSYADVVSVAAPAVVTIRTEGRARMSPTQFQVPDDELFRRFFGDQFGGRGQRGTRPPRQRGLGSGVIASPDGYILTNHHVVDGADQIRVELNDNRTVTAKLVGSDQASDLAVIKIDASNLHPMPFGNSDGVKVGDVVLAVGNPLGVGQTVTMGIISAKSRATGTGNGSYEDFLQTDAPINQGNSGGALVNMKGELVGINSQILSGTGGNIGIGFAIPVNMAKHVMDDLRTKGKVTRGQLGVNVQQITPDLASSLGLKDSTGVVVSGVSPDSAAERAGVKRGDVIRSFNGQPVHDTNALRNRVADAGPGSTAEVVIVRDGSEKRLSVKLDEATPAALARGGGAESDSERSDDKTALGISVAPLTPDIASQLGVPKNLQGLVVENVNPDGRAADAGLERGDVIQEANRQVVKTVDDLRAAARRSADRPLLLLINRDGRDIFVTIKPSNG